MKFFALHSTMYLFLHDDEVIKENDHHTLHSTMYLFLLATITGGISWIDFTFHNVSISTVTPAAVGDYFNALHSTMYLFLRKQPMTSRSALRSLHSTMYLFLQLFSFCKCQFITLYIPQCIYFYGFGLEEAMRQISLYIPQCIYFYTIRQWER